MAFIRDYSEQHAGDPFRRVIRAGKLVRKVPTFARGTRSLRLRARAGVSPRFAAIAGDPFRFRLPKFVRKLSLKKIVKAALPLAGFIPGVGGLVAGLAGGMLGGHAPEQDAAIAMPEPTGTVGEVSRESSNTSWPGVNHTQDEEAEEFYGGPDDEDEDEGDFEDDFAGYDTEA